MPVLRAKVLRQLGMAHVEQGIVQDEPHILASIQLPGQVHYQRRSGDGCEVWTEWVTEEMAK